MSEAEAWLDLGGTFRARAAEETLARVQPYLRRFGITRVANVTGLDTVGIPVWMAVRPESRSLAVSQGKGVTHALARASAVMEGIEFHYAEGRLPEGRPFSLGEAVASSDFADPTLLPLRNDAAFREDRVLPWLEAEEYGTGRPVWVPRELVDIDALSAHRFERLFNTSSTGLASGNTRVEAVLHGLCEAVERDQEAFWTVFEGLTHPSRNSRVALDTIDDPVCRALVDKIIEAGLRLAVWSMDLELGIPGFVVSTWDEERRTLFQSREGGQGTHPYKRIALARALTESVQSRLTFISGARDDNYWSTYRDNLDVSLPKHARFIEHANSTTSDVDFRALPEAPPLEGPSELLEWMHSRLHEAGLGRCLVIDLSEPDLPLSVVKVVVPGLELSPGRKHYTPGPRMLRYLMSKELLK